MNIAENLDRIEAAVDSLKHTIKVKDAGDPQDINDVAEMINNLDSPIVSDPQFVFYDGSTAESLAYGLPLEIRMQVTHIENGIIGIPTYIQDLDTQQYYIHISNGHMSMSYYNSYDQEHTLRTITDPDPLDTSVHTWVFYEGMDYNRVDPNIDPDTEIRPSEFHAPFIAKDGVIIAEDPSDKYVFIDDYGATFFRQINEVEDIPWTGKAKVYHITPNAYLTEDSSGNVVIDKGLADQAAEFQHYPGTYYPKHRDSETVAKLMSEYNYAGWTDSSVEAALLNENSGRQTATYAEYVKFDFPYLLTSKTVDASISTVVYDASSDGFYGYSQVTVNAVDASIDSNIKAENIKHGVQILGVTGVYQGSGGSAVFQSKTIDIDIDTSTNTVYPDDGYDGFDAVTIDASTLNTQRTEIYNRLLGISGSTIINYVLDETQAQTILTELEGI